MQNKQNIETPLIIEWVVHGLYDRVDTFLKQNGNVNTTWQGLSLLRWAVQERWLDISRLLLKNGANVNAIDTCDKTPLSSASSDGNADMVQLLLKAGAVVTDEVPLNFPLHDAAAYGHSDILRILLRYSKRNNVNLIDTQDDEGNTALIYTSMYDQVDSFYVLIKNGAVKSIKNKKGKDALFYASKNKNTEIIKVLKA